MIVEEDIDAFLEHHGIKGQKWGIRNAASSVGRGAKKTGRFVKKHKKGIAIGVGVGSVAIGSAFMAKHLMAMRTPMSEISKSQASVGKAFLTDAQRSEFHKARMRQQIRKDVATRQAKLLREINSDAKKHFDLIQTPHPQREFFDPSHWDKLASSL